jgi:hypothetical protein
VEGIAGKMPPEKPAMMNKNIAGGLSRSISRRATYDKPLQHTAKLRAAKRNEKQEVSSSED